MTLEGCYEVYLGNAAVGKVEIRPQGLYLRIVCRCTIPSDLVFRLYAQLGDRRESIGVVVPEGDGFALDRKLPAKRFTGQSIRFFLSSGGGERTGTFVPICPEEPFQYIDRLKTAFLASENGKVGIRIEEIPETVQ